MLGEDRSVDETQALGGASAIAAGGQFKLYTLSVSEFTQSRALQSGNMDKHVLLTIFWSDETETFRSVKPLNSAYGH
jgi:hypothetical protein